MVKIRLRRVGAKKQPSYRVVVSDSRSPRDGRFIETIGHYNPRTDPPTVVIHEDRALYWLSVGAQPTEPIARFFNQLGLPDKLKQVHGGAAIADVAAPAAGAAAKAKKSKTPATPEMTEAPAVAVETPAAEVKAPAIEVEAPMPEVETPAAEVEVPTAKGSAKPTAEPVEKAAAKPKAKAAAETADEVVAAADEGPETAVPSDETSQGDLSTLGLSSRVQGALEAAGIDSVAALTSKAAEGDEALVALPGVGAKAVEEIREKLTGSDA